VADEKQRKILTSTASTGISCCSEKTIRGPSSTWRRWPGTTRRLWRS